MNPTKYTPEILEGLIRYNTTLAEEFQRLREPCTAREFRKIAQEHADRLIKLLKVNPDAEPSS